MSLLVWSEYIWKVRYRRKIIRCINFISLNFFFRALLIRSTVILCTFFFYQSSRARRPWGGKRSSHEEGEEDSSEDDTGKRQPFKTARDQLVRTSLSDQGFVGLVVFLYTYFTKPVTHCNLNHIIWWFMNCLWKFWDVKIIFILLSYYGCCFSDLLISACRILFYGLFHWRLSTLPMHLFSANPYHFRKQYYLFLHLNWHRLFSLVQS